MADLKKLEETLEQMINLMITMKQSLSEPDKPSIVPPIEDASVSEQLIQATKSDKWPEAVNPHLICDPNSEQDKNERAQGVIEMMIEQDLRNLKVLDFGCGEGQCVSLMPKYGTKLAAGYDIKAYPQWKTFNNDVILTDDFDVIKSHAPFDVIILFDVIDHTLQETPLSILNKCREVLSDSGRIYMRCHPFTSKHATHLYHEINKAYLHLIFNEEELKQLVQNSAYCESNNGVVDPLKTYNLYIEQANLKIINRRESIEDTNPFFKIPKIAERILRKTKMPSFPEDQMSIQFVDYILQK
jgi:2-polyprenyl-3-methyl-5-hydroxy-6-metoxy-1,4-benzoquinol methylase